MICCNKVTNYPGQKQKKTKEISFKSKYFSNQNKNKGANNHQHIILRSIVSPCLRRR